MESELCDLTEIVNSWSTEKTRAVMQKMLLCAKAGVMAAEKLHKSQKTQEIDLEMAKDIKIFIRQLELAIVEEQKGGMP